MSKILTDNFGHKIYDNQNSLRAGERGPTLLEDFIFREKIFHFDHERIPERIVHARGSGAHGYFKCTNPIPSITKAAPFQTKGHKTPVFVRFSTVAGGAGSIDTPRDVRGFATKFYTEEGNWDLVGNNIPVFFIQDAIKFPDLIHSVKMEASNGYPQAATAHDTFWDFVSLVPETYHTLFWAMSDRGIPRSFRNMEGFGVHTFRFVNSKDEYKYVKFHWKPVLGLQSTTWNEALKIAGADPDYHRRDLYEAIDRKEFPEWELGVQIFDEEFAANLPYDILDPTKIIPEEDVPITIVGKMVLNKNPDNFFAETEQAAFLPSNIIPGIDFTNDPLLQGRLFSYLDTQKSRLGTTNFHQIPINAPKCPFANFQRDGMMQTHIFKGRANYQPNSLSENKEEGGPSEDKKEFQTIPINSERNDPRQKLRVRASLFKDHYSQPRLYYKSLAPIEQSHLIYAIIFELSKVSVEKIVNRNLANLQNVDIDLAKRVAKGLNLELPPASTPDRSPIDLKPSKSLSIIYNMKDTLQGRTVGILVDDDSPKEEVDELKSAIEKEKGRAVLISQKKGGKIGADARIDGTPSVTLDAIALVLTEEGAKKLSNDRIAVQFVMDAFDHLKCIGYVNSARALLNKAGVELDSGVVALGDFVKGSSKRYYEREAKIHPLP